MNEPTTIQLVEGLIDSKMATMKTAIEHASAMLKMAEDNRYGSNQAICHVEAALNEIDTAAKAAVEYRCFKHHFSTAHAGLIRDRSDD